MISAVAQIAIHKKSFKNKIQKIRDLI